ncbi:MAG TPA: VCBS repeat-containing protein, partial [Nannocystaceae bacterium]|nr:VCBS repeat-containing protein [Nannocystaceae bacterium]
MRSSVLLVPLVIGCTDRRYLDADCGDGHAVAGEACFGDERETIAVAFTPVATRVADFDGDDDVDVLVLGVDPVGGVTSSIAVNDGAGALALPIAAGVVGCSAHPALGDADVDGATDLLVATCESSMWIYRAEGDASFAPPIAVDVGALPRTSGIVDIDGDALPDVVVLGIIGDAAVLTWARGQGALAWASPTVDVVGTVGHPDDPTAFSIAQLDDDAIADAVLSHAAPDVPPLLVRGAPDGFGAPEPWDELPVALGVAAIDLDGREDAELVAITDGGDTIEVYRGRFGSLKRVGTTDISGQRGRLLAVGDIDGDRRL